MSAKLLKTFIVGIYLLFGLTLSYAVERQSSYQEEVIVHTVKTKTISEYSLWIQNTYKYPSTYCKHIATAIVEHSYKHNIDPSYILAMGVLESSLNPKVRHPNGHAVGIMGIVPKWHKQVIKNKDIRDPVDNISIGVIIFSNYLKDSNGNYTLAFKKYSGNHKNNSYEKKVMKLVKQIGKETKV